MHPREFVHTFETVKPGFVRFTSEQSVGLSFFTGQHGHEDMFKILQVRAGKNVFKV
jgi:hypothetical protein